VGIVSWIPFGLWMIAGVYVGRHYSAAYAAAYGRIPSFGWFLKTDDDPTVERWRRRSLVVLVAFLILLIILGPILHWP